MTVLSVAYPLLPVGPDSGGGAEQILSLLDRGLVAAGHRSIVIAAEGSDIAGELITTPAVSSRITEAILGDARRRHLDGIREVLRREPVDMVHFHGLDFQSYVPVPHDSVLATLHLPLSWYRAGLFDVPGITLNCVSEMQARCAPDQANPPVISNGVDVERYLTASCSREFLLWLGRVCPEKGIHIGLQISHRLDLPMMVAGPVHPFDDHRIYFAQQVQPLLDDKRRYLGPVGLSAKAHLLSQARCVLIPSLAAEPSSLIAMEAISAGTPVIAFRSGALPEVIEDGITGFVVDSEEQMADAVKHLSQISSEVCRARAKLRFDARRMVRDYIQLYRKIIANSTSHALQ